MDFTTLNNQGDAKMETKIFQAETKELLDLMIHSIYTHKEIFLRELVSNASDAIDKIKFKSLTEPEILEKDNDFKIKIDIDKNNRTITISDNGIGMTYDDVVANIGTIAKSGTKEFFQKLAENKDENPDLIGQFGVGFYSAFMVAEKVTLHTKAPGEETGVIWESDGSGSYTIDKKEKDSRGTTITLHLREREDEDEDYLNQYEIESLIKKYSDYVRYPIMMDFYTEKPEEKDEKGNVTKESEIEVETRTLNSMVPLWQKSRNEISDEEYTQFYRQSFHAWDDPIDRIHTKGEGTIEYTALLYIPEKAPFDYYSMNYERGIKLYSKQVFIMEKCKELLPEYLGFVKGLVDSPDFSLNISREILQHSRQLKVIAKNIEKKVIDSLKYMMKTDREKYVKFWNEFGRAMKAGVYADFGANKEKLQDLLLFDSSNSEKSTSLKEYVERMPEHQKEIYFAAGKDRQTVESMPQMEMFKEKGIEVLYFTDKIDEFTSTTLRDYDGKALKSIAQGDIDLGTEEEKEEKKESKKKKEQENKDLLKTLKDHLGTKISEVRLSSRLTSSPVCIVGSESGVSLNMEQILQEAAAGDMPAPKADRVLELNPEHEIFNIVQKIHTADPQSEKLKSYAELLYNQALLMEGLSIENPQDMVKRISELMVEAADK